MKIAILADLHLNKTYKNLMDKDNPNLPFRTVDYMRSLEWIIDKIIEINPDLVEITGDIYHTPYPSTEVRSFFYKQITKLKMNNIPVIILVGNHDSCLQNHALLPLKSLNLDGVTVVDTPSLIDFKGFKLILMPYSINVEQKKVSLKEELCSFLKKHKHNFDYSKTIFFGHFGVNGASLNSYVSSDGKTISFINDSKTDVSISDLDKIGAEYIFLGDYHEFQILPTKKCIAMYTGSIEKSDISELNQKKGFVLFDSDTKNEITPKMGKCKFIEYPNCRPILFLSGSLHEMKKDFDFIIEKDIDLYKNAIVKLDFYGDRHDDEKFSLNYGSFKKFIDDKINPIYIDVHKKIIDEKQDKLAKSLEEEIIESDIESGNEEVLVLMKEMLREFISDEEELKKMDEMLDLIFIKNKVKS